MLGIKNLFIWWEKQTIGTFIRTLFFRKFVGKDKFGNKYYHDKNDKRWVVYSKYTEATQITDDWYLWMHYTSDKIPSKDYSKKYSWQKDHVENLTGTNKSYKPNKIRKNTLKKKYESWKSN